MGRLDVRIRHGGGNGSSTALLVLGGLAIAAIGGSSMASVGAEVGSLLDTLLITAAIVVGGLLLAAVVLLIVFRKRILASFRPSPVVWRQIGPGQPAQKVPQHVHLHYHAADGQVIGPNGMIQQMPAWGELFPTTYDRPELGVEPDDYRADRARSGHPVPAPVYRRLPR